MNIQNTLKKIFLGPNPRGAFARYGIWALFGLAVYNHPWWAVLLAGACVLLAGSYVGIIEKRLQDAGCEPIRSLVRRARDVYEGDPELKSRSETFSCLIDQTVWTFVNQCTEVDVKELVRYACPLSCETEAAKAVVRQAIHRHFSDPLFPFRALIRFPSSADMLFFEWLLPEFKWKEDPQTA